MNQKAIIGITMGIIIIAIGAGALAYNNNKVKIANEAVKQRCANLRQALYKANITLKKAIASGAFMDGRRQAHADLLKWSKSFEL
jgi:hypothetical protein